MKNLDFPSAPNEKFFYREMIAKVESNTRHTIAPFAKTGEGNNFANNLFQ